MTKRLPEKQSEHDRVIAASAKTWQKNPLYVVHTNPNGEQNFSVNGDQFPDVIITDSNNKLLAVEEIETEDSVAEEESKQWLTYSRFGVPLHLVVPAQKVNDAINLTRHMVNIKIQEYYIEDNEIKFSI